MKRKEVQRSRLGPSLKAMESKKYGSAKNPHPSKLEVEDVQLICRCIRLEQKFA